MTRTFARSRRGLRAVDYAPQGHWNTTTLVAAITQESALAPMVLDGPMDVLAFETYVEHVLIPALPADAIVVMDNLSPHKASTISRLLHDACPNLRFGHMSHE